MFPHVLRGNKALIDLLCDSNPGTCTLASRGALSAKGFVWVHPLLDQMPDGDGLELLGCGGMEVVDRKGSRQGSLVG
jgi:hypothetical protein